MRAYSRSTQPDTQSNFGRRVDCNTVLGTFSQAGADLRIQVRPSTLVACPPRSLEQEFKRDLAQLVLQLGPGGHTITLAATPAPDASGPMWNVNDGRAPLVSLLAHTTLTVVFGPQRVSGTSGCTEFSGPYIRTDNSILVARCINTRGMRCRRHAARGAVSRRAAGVDDAVAARQSRVGPPGSVFAGAGPAMPRSGPFAPVD